MEERKNWIDYAKAIGIILVVYGHEMNGLYNSGIYHSEASFFLWDSVIYSFHMPLFFFLSGLLFTTSLKKRGGRQLILNKIDTIFYPYLLWSLLQGSMECFFSKFTYGDLSFSEILTLLWNPRAQFWFLYALFFIFLTTTVIYSVFQNRIRHQRIFGSILLLIAIAMYLYEKLLPDWTVLILIKHNFVFFVFGIVFSAFNLDFLLSYKRALFFFAVLFISVQWFFHGYLALRYADKGMGTLILAFVSILFVVAVSENLSQYKLKRFQEIGISSMSIYLIHIITGSGIRIIMQKIFGINSFALHITIGCLASVVIPIVVMRYVGKYRIPFIFSAPISSCINSCLRNTRNLE